MQSYTFDNITSLNGNKYVSLIFFNAIVPDNDCNSLFL